MNPAALTTLQTVNTELAEKFTDAAPDTLSWSQERAFFEAQVGNVWQLRDAVERNVSRTIESMQLAVRECASMGLSMSPAAQLVYFIPRRERKRFNSETKAEYAKNVPWVVTATPSYRGLCYIACHYAGAAVCAAEVVYKADRFAYFGPLQQPRHEQTLEAKERTQAKAIGVYAIVILENGIARTEYIDRATIDRIRARSDNKNGLMWREFWTEGWRKAALRRICKTVLTGSPRMAMAQQTLNVAEGITLDGDVSRETSGPDDRPEADKGMSGLSQALDQSKARQAQPEAAEQPEEREPVTIDQTAEPTIPDPRGPQEDPQATFPEPVDTEHPALSIEWWAEKIKLAENIDQLDQVRAEMIFRGVDNDQDKAPPLREIYGRRSKALREEAA